MPCVSGCDLECCLGLCCCLVYCPCRCCCRAPVIASMSQQPCMLLGSGGSRQARHVHPALLPDQLACIFPCTRHPSPHLCSPARPAHLPFTPPPSPPADEELDAILPGEAEGYKVVPPPPGYAPIRTPARKAMATPTPFGGMATPLYSVGGLARPGACLLGPV